MSYSVRVYMNTGFNAENIPDTPALLDTCQKLDLPAIEVLQERILSSIRVRVASWSVIQDADYCRINDWYYFITDMKMTSVDTCVIYLEPDYLLSAGGAGTLVYSDGITDRVCVPVLRDTYGSYTQEDELTTPVNSLELVQQYIKPKNSASVQQEYHVGADDEAYITLIESTIDLESNDSKLAEVYVDTNGQNSVTVPVCNSVNVSTEHMYGGEHGTLTYPLQWPETDGQGGWQYTKNVIRTVAINRARSLGYETGIVSQYQIPMWAYSETASQSYDSPAVVTSGVLNKRGGFKKLTPIQSEIDADNLPWEQSINGYTVKNKRALYGEFLKYGLLTMAGNRVEFDASTIYGGIQGNYPTVICRPDIRSDGCPYFRFLLNNGSSISQGFWENAVAGANWKQVPLVYNQKSGGQLERLQYDAKRSYGVTEFNVEYGWLGFGERLAKNLIRSISAAGDTERGMSPGGVMAGGAFGGILSEAVLQEKGKTLYNKSSIGEVLDYVIGQAKAPEIQFPYNSDIMRDALGNGVIVYRYYYTEYDLKRVDRLLTMYGYKYTKKLEASDFTNRPKFNYVKAVGATVTGGGTTGRVSLPSWWNDGIAQQLSDGVRVWHVLPDVSVYDTGNI